MTIRLQAGACKGSAASSVHMCLTKNLPSLRRQRYSGWSLSGSSAILPFCGWYDIAPSWTSQHLWGRRARQYCCVKSQVAAQTGGSSVQNRVKDLKLFPGTLDHGKAWKLDRSV